MAFERSGREQNEREPSLWEVLVRGVEVASAIGNAINDAQRQEGEMKRDIKDSFEQFMRHPDLADRIGINLGGNFVNRLQEMQRKRVQERTAIHQKTVETMRRFRQQQGAHQAATQQEQEAAQQSQEAARDIDEVITSGIRELTARINKWSGRKPKT